MALCSNFPFSHTHWCAGDFFSYESVQKKRPFIIILILILAALLTPPDIVSQLMLGTPTYLLFEAGLFFARKYRNASTMKEQRDARDIASFDVFATNGGSKKNGRN
ncbi:twin-arginine translocase subunit TatC [Fibrobacter intestinalis]|uniref:twin-arginine translocase subunit TatC n=1 Tax=Fibrobacter intestinalis TaxID=28122 RepID=UPI003CC83A16